MKPILLALFLLCPIFGQASAQTEDSAIAATLEVLREAVNRHDFAGLESQLAPDFAYAGYDGMMGRRIMERVVDGFPQAIDRIVVDRVDRRGDTIELAVTLHLERETSERRIALDSDYRIVEAAIADIQLAGHGNPSPPQPQSDPALPDRTVIPFRLVDRIIIVQAEVAGVAGNFVLDSGAPSLILNRRYFTDAGLQTRDLDHPNPTGAGGEMTEVRAAIGLELRWDDIRMDDQQGLVTDLAHLEKNLGVSIVGLIGQSILEPFEARFDYRAQSVTLTRLDTDGTPVISEGDDPPALTMPFELAGHVPVIAVTVGDRDLQLGLDSGAAGAMIFTRWRDSLAGQYVVVDRRKLTGADRNVQMGDVVEVERMTLGGLDYGRMQFRFNDIAGHDASFDGLLGYQFLASRPTAINYRTRRLLVWPEAT
jgi:hypothetical protein